MFISCDEKKAKDEITKAIDETVAEADKGTSPVKPQGKTIQVVQGKVQITEGDAESTPGGEPETIVLTKPILSAYRVRKETPITFPKVARHTYSLKNATSDVTISDVKGDTTKKQVSSTVIALGVIVVATFDGNTSESEPVDFLLHVANRKALQDEIKTAIGRYGNSVSLNYLDTSEVVSMVALFNSVEAFNGDISKWDVSSVESMTSIFDGLTMFNSDISKWDVSSVTDMRSMFYEATSFNQPLNNWKVSQVTNMYAMFNGASAFNQPLDTWNVAEVTDIQYMFNGATSFNQNISNWVDKSGRKSRGMFHGANAMQEDYKPSWAR